MSKKKVTSQKCDSGHRRDVCRKDSKLEKRFINVWSNQEQDVGDRQPVSFNRISANVGFDNPGPGIFFQVVIPVTGFYDIFWTTQVFVPGDLIVGPSPGAGMGITPINLPHRWAAFALRANSVIQPSTLFANSVIPGIGPGNAPGDLDLPQITIPYVNDVQVIGGSIQLLREGTVVELVNVSGDNRTLNDADEVPDLNVSASLKLILLHEK